MSILPTFYGQLFHTKVSLTAFLYFNLRLILLWRKNIAVKATLKMLVKLNPGVNLTNVVKPKVIVNYYTNKQYKTSDIKASQTKLVKLSFFALKIFPKKIMLEYQLTFNSVH